MRKNLIYCIVCLFAILGCKRAPIPDSSESNFNPNSIKDLSLKFNVVKPCTFKQRNNQITIGGLYISKKPISVNDYFSFVQDISNGIKKVKLGDSLSYYFDVYNSPIFLNNDSLEMNSGTQKNPMTYVSYYGAKSYCEWLTRKYSNLDNMPMFRLPSEYEWLAALKQKKVNLVKMADYKDWVEESICTETYKPLVRIDCVNDWFNPYPSPISDSIIVKQVIDLKLESHHSFGVSKSFCDSTIGFRVAQTNLRHFTSNEF